jgi:hypothetical protein
MLAWVAGNHKETQDGMRCAGLSIPLIKGAFVGLQRLTGGLKLVMQEACSLRGG